MTVELRQIASVRCRPIADSDLNGLADLLTRGFPATRRSTWTNGFARWQQLPQIEGLPRYGYLLDAGQGPVGVVLLISSRRGDQVIANLSSWYVEPDWRAHSAMLIGVATRLKRATYLNVSPAPHTWRTLQAQGLRPTISAAVPYSPCPAAAMFAKTSRTICPRRSCSPITARWA